MSIDQIISRLGKTVTTRRKTVTVDASGSTIDTFANNLTGVKAAIFPQSQDEALEGGRELTLGRATVYVSAGRDIQAGDELEWSGSGDAATATVEINTGSLVANGEVMVIQDETGTVYRLYAGTTTNQTTFNNVSNTALLASNIVTCINNLTGTPFSASDAATGVGDNSLITIVQSNSGFDGNNDTLTVEGDPSGWEVKTQFTGGTGSGFAIYRVLGVTSSCELPATDHLSSMILDCEEVGN